MGPTEKSGPKSSKPKPDPKETPVVQRILPDKTEYPSAQSKPMTASAAANKYWQSKHDTEMVNTGHMSRSRVQTNGQMNGQVNGQVNGHANPYQNGPRFDADASSAPPTQQVDANEILVKFKVGEWSNFHMAAYQDWSQDAVMNLDINLLNLADPTDGRRPIHIACQYDNYRFLKTILNFYELDLNAVDHHGYTALHIAAKHGHERCLNILILTNKVNLDLGGFDCPCPLHLAVANEEIGCVRVLLQAGANVNATYGQKARTALHLAARKGDEPMVDLLTTYKPYNCGTSSCRPGIVDDNGRTALHYAAGNNHSGVVEMLVFAGAKVNRRTDEGKTALHIAAEKGFKKTTKVLLKYGVDPDAVDKWGMKAIEYAMERGHDELIGILNSPKSGASKAKSKSKSRK